jgi:sortase A
MSRARRVLGGLLLAAGALTLAWTVAVWRWQDPFTGLYTHWQQHRLAQQLEQVERAYQPARPSGDLVAERRIVALDAQRFDRGTETGNPLGRIVIRRIGLDMVLVKGTDHETLKKGPGLDTRSHLPGEDRLVYIAGHRTTYLAPFSHIDEIQDGDSIRLELPYATFVYRTFKHRIVAAGDLTVLRSPPYEQLELQACHPRFFATHRYIVYAHLVAVHPHGMPAYALAAASAGS